MVESEAKELAEEIMLGAVMFGHRHFQPVINAIIELAEKAAKEPREIASADNSELERRDALGSPKQDLRAAYAIAGKRSATTAVEAAKAKVMAHFFPARAPRSRAMTTLRVAGAFKELEAKIVR